MTQAPTFSIAFGPWTHPTDRASLEAALRTATAAVVGQVAGVPQVQALEREVFVAPLGLGGLLSTLSVGCRNGDWAAAILLNPTDRQHSQGRRVLRQARRVPWGVKVQRDADQPAIDAVQATLGLHVSALRRRTAEQWAAIDAVRRHGSASAAATELGCSSQAISTHLRLAGVRATAGTGTILHALLVASARAVASPPPRGTA
jgi:hypothetical protein